MPMAEQRGGAELMLLHLLRANREGPQIEYHLAFLEDGPMVEEVKTLGYPTCVFPAGQLRQIHRQILTVLALKQWMQTEQIKIVLSWMEKAHLYGGPAAKMAGIPSVWHQHTIPKGNWLTRWALLIPAEKVFCSSQAAQTAQRKLKPNLETCVIFPGVDLSRLNLASMTSPLEARRRLGLPEQGPLIGVVCRLQHSKGVHIFLEAAAQIMKSYPDAHFVVVGGRYMLEPDYPEVLAAQAGKMGLGESVTFAGHQSDVPLWMQAMDILVMVPIGTESFGMVIVEGMALGKLVIASRAGGPQEIIEDGRDGYLIEQGDISALVRTLETVLAGENSNGEMALAARRKAAVFSTEKLARAVASQLEKIL